jgi:hypothetical protein
MMRLSEFNGLYDQYKDLIDFVVIYIEEAHSIESGDFGPDTVNFRMHNHKNLDMRLESGKVLAQHTKVPIYVDDMENGGNLEFGASPERFYVLRDGLVAMQGAFGPDGKMSEVSDWIEKNRHTLTAESCHEAIAEDKKTA